MHAMKLPVARKIARRSLPTNENARMCERTRNGHDSRRIIDRVDSMEGASSHVQRHHGEAAGKTGIPCIFAHRSSGGSIHQGT